MSLVEKLISSIFGVGVGIEADLGEATPEVSNSEEQISIEEHPNVVLFSKYKSVP